MSAVASPPSYPQPPSYTLDARPDERTLTRTARRHRPRTTQLQSQSQCVVKGAVGSVVLHGQSTQPSYGRGGVLDGSVRLNAACTKRVTDISIVVRTFSFSPPYSDAW